VSTIIFFDKVVITSENDTTSLVMLGGGSNGGVVQQDSLPRLTAIAYLEGVALDPQPGFHWESSNPCVCAVDQAGNCTRVVNKDASSYDSQGLNSTGQLGGISRIRATAKRPNGDVTGCWGEISVVVQAQAPRMYHSTRGSTPANDSRSAGYFNLVGKG
jgi:hypothetical protein